MRRKACHFYIVAVLTSHEQPFDDEADERMGTSLLILVSEDRQSSVEVPHVGPLEPKWAWYTPVCQAPSWRAVPSSSSCNRARRAAMAPSSVATYGADDARPMVYDAACASTADAHGSNSGVCKRGAQLTHRNAQ
jgi:hypothetical protein